jgi:SPP1 family predicted phage head-tail adaptor
MSDPTIESGTLDKRVTLLEPVYNEPQDEITGWNPVANVWAGIAPISNAGREMTQSARTIAITMITITIRFRADIDPRWRIQDRDRIYQIRSMVDTLRRHVQLQLACEEIE